MNCPACGAYIQDNNIKFCPKCGASLFPLTDFQENFSIKTILQYGFSILKSNFIPSFIVTSIILLSVILQNVKSAILLSNFLIIITHYYLTRFSIAIPEGQFKLDKSLLKLSSGNFWKFLLSEIIFSIITVIGLSFFILPGLFLIVRLRFWNFALIDKKVSVFASLKYSWVITKGHFLDILKWLFTIFLINIIGILFLLIGIVITYPISIYGDYFLYKKLSYGVKL